MISLILAIMLLGFVNKPCADEVESIMENGTEQFEVIDHPEPTPEDHEDDCSPFCSCNCCQAQMANTPRLLFAHLPIIDSENFSNQSSKPSQISFAIWEPPQLR